MITVEELITMRKKYMLEKRKEDTSGSFLRKITSSRASSVFSHTIFPSLEANTTPPELKLKKKIKQIGK
jgi:hypothetical protein